MANAAEPIGATRLSIPEPYSYAAPLFYIDIDVGNLGQGIYVNNPYNGGQPQLTRFRGFNCLCDLTSPANLTIVYVGEDGNQYTYRPAKSGLQLCVNWGVISYGSAVDNLQVWA